MTNDKNYIPAEQFAGSLNDYLQEGHYKGVKFSLGEMNGFQFSSYMNNGVFATSPRNWNKMRADICLPEEELFKQLYLSAPEKPYAFKNKVLGIGQYRAGIEKLTTWYPQLKDVSLTMDSQNAEPFIYLEDKPLWVAVAWYLQTNSTDATVMKNCISANDEMQKTIIQNFVQIPFDEKRQDAFNSLAMPQGSGYLFASDKLYVFEKGTLGFIQIGRDRVVTKAGDDLSPAVQNWAENLAASQNILNDAGFAYFHRLIDEKKHLVIDKNDRSVHAYSVIPCINQEDVHIDHERRCFSSKKVEGMIEVTDRIKAATIVSNDNKHMLRCKIDGMQQFGVELKYDDYKEYVYNRMTPEHLAAKYHAANLIAASREQVRTMKR